jgi:hypothetical protein
MARTTYTFDRGGNTVTPPAFDGNGDIWVGEGADLGRYTPATKTCKLFLVQ